VSARGEEAFVAWLQRRLPDSALVGDDTAEIRAGGRLVVTVDQQIEGTHYTPGLDPKLVGRRLLRVNLSDLAASGARPKWAFLALGVPPEIDPRRIVEGVLHDSGKFGVQLAGGDVAHSELITAGLTLIGEKPARSATLARDRARPGQTLYLSGPVGESALGCELLLRGAEIRGRSVRFPPELELPPRLLPAARRAIWRNVLPEPRLALGAQLAALGRKAGAVIDVSDGLAKDLRRICAASGVGCELDLSLLRRTTVPRFDELAAALDLDPVAAALAGGEDYALLFTLGTDSSPNDALPIGRITAGRRLRLLDRDGLAHPLPELGWDHLS
jgi:thiamine-monophosphate kinase